MAPRCSAPAKPSPIVLRAMWRRAERTPAFDQRAASAPARRSGPRRAPRRRSAPAIAAGVGARTRAPGRALCRVRARTEAAGTSRRPAARPAPAPAPRRRPSNGDRPLDGQRVDARPRDWSAPPKSTTARSTAPHHGDLLLDAAAAIVEVLVEGFVLDMVPADADAEPQAAAAEDVDLGRLLGHERRLPLRQIRMPVRARVARAGRQVAEEHERLVEGVVDVVGRFHAIPGGCAPHRPPPRGRTRAGGRGRDSSALWAKSRISTGSSPISFWGKTIPVRNPITASHSRRSPGARAGASPRWTRGTAVVKALDAFLER